MIELGELNDKNVLTVQVSGKLVKKDYERIIPELEKLLDEHDNLRFFIVMHEMKGIEWEAVKEDIKFDLEHMKQYGRTAVVGENRWEEWMMKAAGLFMGFEMRFFYPHQSDEAWAWVNED